MPSASANISAKFIAQIEMSSSWVARYSEPAEATSPRIVSINGSPAATSDPKASTRMTIVTGQLNSSERIIAVRLAVLKSDHIPLAPVSETCTPSPCRPCSCVLRSSAARTMVLASAAAPACTTAVWPSREIDTPGRGATTDFTRRSPFRTSCVEASARWNTGSPTVLSDECTTTIRALEDRPWKFWPMAVRAATDSEPVASQPAPDSAVSTLGAKTPSTTATSAQPITTARKCVAVWRPRRPIGPYVAVIEDRPPWGTGSSEGRTRG